jgi:KAP family P-loop domain
MRAMLTQRSLLQGASCILDGNRFNFGVSEARVRRLLKELGIEEGEDLEQVLVMAAAAHTELVDRQEEAGPLSRTALIRAAIHVSAPLRHLLEECGLIFARLEPRHIPALRKLDPDMNVNEHVVAALRSFARTWPNRPLDAFGLGAAIVMNAHSVVEERLTAAGLNLGMARERIVGAMADQPHWNPDWILPFEKINEFSFSGGCRRWLNDALYRISDRGRSAPVVTSSVLLATAFQIHIEPLASIEIPEETIDRWLRWYDGTTAEGIPPFITVPAFNAIRAASEHAQGAAQRLMVHSEDLLAILLTRDKEFLEFAGVNVNDVKSALMHYVETKHPGQHLDVWRKRLSIVTPPPRHVSAPVDIESLEGEDLLGFKRDVDSFAKLIAASDVTPPLSIGLFGDWGSGKSFFMNKLKKRINVLAGEARDREDRNEKSAFHSHIVQIDFNAWHYVEANLWASLVEHIFRNLKFAGETEDDAKRRRKEILEELDSAIGDRMRAEEEVETRQQERNARAHDLEMKQHAADGAEAKFQRLMSVKPWDAIELSDDTSKHVREALVAVGMQHGVKTAATAREVVGELSALGNRGRVIWNWLWSGPKWRVAGLAAILIVPLLVTLSIPFLDALGDLRWLTTGIADVAALAAGAFVWLRRHGGALGDVFKKIERAQLAVDESMLAYEKKRTDELQRFEREKATAEARLAEAKKALHAADDAVRAAENKLAELAPDRQLSRFIADRAASDDYRKLLGVLAMVRNDFDKLSDLLTKQERGVTGKFRIDRIVLYIDDLDRCPPQRVVEVLQAVHLLLAFKLFVVVVGVDARWVARALETRHKSQWRNAGRRTNDAKGQTVPGFGATPEDYLEKIFQVPFWIDPMNADATKELLRGIVTIKEQEAAPQKELPKVAAPAPAATKPVVTQPVQPIAAAGTPKLTIRAGDDEHNPEALQLDRNERDAMERLAPLILRSPRSVKRFANVYRIVRAGIEADKLTSYLDGSYEQTLLLLGLICGTPSAAPELFQRIRIAKSDENLKSFVAALGPSGWRENTVEHAEWARATAALSEFAESREALTVDDLRPDIRRLCRYSFRHGTV